MHHRLLYDSESSLSNDDTPETNDNDDDTDVLSRIAIFARQGAIIQLNSNHSLDYELKSIDPSETEHQLQTQDSLRNDAKYLPFGIMVYYIFRILCISLTLFLCIVSVYYGLSQILILENIDFFCSVKTAEQVHEHSRQLNTSIGVGGCWFIEFPLVDNNKLGDSSMKAVWDINIDGLINCSLFCLIALILLMHVLYHGFYTLYDLYYQCKNESNPRVIEYMKHGDKKQNCVHNCCCNCDCKCLCFGHIKNCYYKLRQWKGQKMYPDSKLQIIFSIFMDLFETGTQLWSLLIYSGFGPANLFDNIVLSVHPWFVKGFAWIVGLNCCINGLLWIFYVVFFDKMSGQRYLFICFVVDTIGDLLYTLFPTSLYQTNHHFFGILSFDKNALASLHNENGFIFVGMKYV